MNARRLNTGRQAGGGPSRLMLGVVLTLLLWVLPAQAQDGEAVRRFRLLESRYRRAVEENERLKQALEAAKAELAALRHSLKHPAQALEYRAVIDRLSEAIEASPGNPDLYKNRGIALRHVGDYAEAVRDLSRAIQLDGSDARTYNERGTAYFLTRDLERAQEDFSRAIALDAELGEAYHNRAVIRRSLGDYARAVRDLRKAEELGVVQAGQTRNRLSAEVEAVQRRLDQLGLEPGPADGIPGRKTVAAVRRLQQKIGLEPTGKVDVPTRAALRTAQRVLQRPPFAASARLLTHPKLEYPPLARERGWEGTVTLRIELLENGRVGDVQVAKSSGHQVLDEAAIESVKRWRHQPATENGVPITREIDFDIEFALDAKSD